MSNPLPAEVEQEIIHYVLGGHKIEAIKLYREHTGQGLKEAKDFIDSLETELRVKEPEKFTAPAGKGCLGMVAVFGLGVLVAVTLLIMGLH